MLKVKHKFFKRVSDTSYLYDYNFIAFKLEALDGKKYGQYLEYSDEDTYIDVLKELLSIKHNMILTLQESSLI